MLKYIKNSSLGGHLICRSTNQRTAATLESEQLPATAAGLKELLVLFYETFQSIPGQFRCWKNQTSGGLFLYLPARDTSAVAFTPWGEMSWGYIPRDEALQSAFNQLESEVVLRSHDGVKHNLRGWLYAVKNVRGHELPPSILTSEDHALEAQLAQQSFDEHFPDFPNSLPII